MSGALAEWHKVRCSKDLLMMGFVIAAALRVGLVVSSYAQGRRAEPPPLAGTLRWPAAEGIRAMSGRLHMPGPRAGVLA